MDTGQQQDHRQEGPARTLGSQKDGRRRGGNDRAPAPGPSRGRVSGADSPTARKSPCPHFSTGQRLVVVLHLLAVSGRSFLVLDQVNRVVSRRVCRTLRLRSNSSWRSLIDDTSAKSFQFLRVVEEAVRLHLFHAFHHVFDLGRQIGVGGKAAAQVPGLSQAVLELLLELAGLSRRQRRGRWQFPIAEIDGRVTPAPAGALSAPDSRRWLTCPLATPGWSP